MENNYKQKTREKRKKETEISICKFIVDCSLKMQRCILNEEFIFLPPPPLS